MSKIGYNDGITAFEAWLREFSRWIDAYNVWAGLPDSMRLSTDPPLAPRLPLEGPRFDPNNPNTHPWIVKFFDNTMRKLKDAHDAEVEPTPTDPTDPADPEPTDPASSGYAPQAYNRGSGGQNARFNIRINCTRRSDGKYVDRRNIVYSDSGLCDGGRSEKDVPGLKPADMMDNKDVWEPYEWMGRTFPPYPPESHDQ